MLGSGTVDDLVSARADVSPTTASFPVMMPGHNHTHEHMLNIISVMLDYQSENDYYILPYDYYIHCIPE